MILCKKSVPFEAKPVCFFENLKKIMNKSFFCFLILILPFGLFAQKNISKNRIDWKSPISVKESETKSKQFLYFDGAFNLSVYDYLPVVVKTIDIEAGYNSCKAELRNAAYVELTPLEQALVANNKYIGNTIAVKNSVSESKKKLKGEASFVPIRKNEETGKYEKLISFELEFTLVNDITKGLPNKTRAYAANSVLKSGSGKWYKVAIDKDGVYKLSYSSLKSMGIDVDAINPQNIRIYGNGGEMLAELNSVPRQDDLTENAIFVQGESDGKFDQSDYVLFYGKGPDTWIYDKNAACLKFRHSVNLYADSAYYFINVTLGAGKRIQAQNSSGVAPTHTVTSFDDYAYHEKENTNFIKSGRLWFGEYFGNTPTYSFPFSFANIDNTKPATVYVSMASRYEDLSGSSNATYSISSQTGNSSIAIPEIIGGGYSDYALLGTTCYSFTPNSSLISVSITKQTTDAEAWLDYIDVNVRRQLVMSNGQMHFRDVESVGLGNIASYTIQSSVAVQVWDITDKFNIRLQNLNSGTNTYQYALPSDTLKQFVAFDGTNFFTPQYCGELANQDLHAIGQKDYIIIAHPNFYTEATQLASFHESKSGLTTVVVTPQQIYNEFSSGGQDISAIRDFMKMFYDRATNASEMPKYLLLFGDGSYDNKKRFGSSNTNFIPTYQSQNSTLVTISYVSDDFYGLLGNGEGIWINNDKVDIGIGRLPVKTKAEAQNALNKIFSYTKTGFVPSTTNNSCTTGGNNSPFGDWRNTVCFVGDDEDANTHIDQANQLATIVDTTYNEYNVDKIYLDAYKQEATPGGQRYPDVVDAIDKRIEKGCLIFNYTGHGGEVGLAHERVIEVPQINKWKNADRLCLFFTATCEFSRYDDPERTSAGEYVFLNPSGGAIALFTTVRLVYSLPNFVINKDFYEKAFIRTNGQMPRLGDLYWHMKNEPMGNSDNSRNFTLLGDPALTLAYPKHTIVTDSINSNVVTFSSNDTLKALSKVTVCGSVKDYNGVLLNNYNGVLYPTVYDKKQNINTLSNDGNLQTHFF